MGTTKRAGRAGKTAASQGAHQQDALVLLVLLELLGNDAAQDDVREGDLFAGAPRNARLEVVR